MKKNEPINVVHCFFEQSGTFKREWKKLGYDAYDYDIQNNFGETDYQIDLFREIEQAYDGKASVFGNITKDDLIMAFFPCIYFDQFQLMHFSEAVFGMDKWSEKRKCDYIIDKTQKRAEFYILLRKLFSVVKMRDLRMILENPAKKPQYLLFPQNFYTPTFIDNNRQLRGDAFKKPTAYWYVNIEPTSGHSFIPPPREKNNQEM